MVCKNLSLGYNGLAAVQGLSFEVRRGDYLCVVGENGSGKTTLLLGLLGLLSPLEGTVVRGAGTTGIGYLPQEIAVKNDFPGGVREIVLSGLAGGMVLRPFDSPGEKLRAERAMERLGIGGLRRRCFRELSGGQKRRVLIARALCASETVLVLDEPAAGLDPGAAAELYKLLEGLNREQGLTIIMVTHDLDAAETYANRILRLGPGGLTGA
jgi:zinc transport system ATP-binding protein